MDHLIKEFEIYLISENISSLTIKNYSVDLRNFLEWFILKLKTKQISINEDFPKTIVDKIDYSTIEDYINFLKSNNTPKKTILRRLSTLRRLGKFAVLNQYLKYNPAQNLSNSQTQNNKVKILDEFNSGLIRAGISKVTAKNYSSDIRQLLNFLEITAIFLIIILPGQSIFKMFLFGGGQSL